MLKLLVDEVIDSANRVTGSLYEIVKKILIDVFRVEKCVGSDVELMLRRNAIGRLINMALNQEAYDSDVRPESELSDQDAWSARGYVNRKDNAFSIYTNAMRTASCRLCSYRNIFALK
jgi:hypothetical protein